MFINIQTRQSQIDTVGGLSTADGYRTTCEACGAVLLPASPAEPICEALGRARNLSRREREVFDLLAFGASNREISEQLHIAEITTRTHVSKVCTKLGVSRLQASMAALLAAFGTQAPTDPQR